MQGRFDIAENTPHTTEETQNTFKIIFNTAPKLSYFFKGIVLSASLFLTVILLTHFITKQPLMAQINQLRAENTRLKTELAQKNALRGNLFPNQNSIVVTALPAPELSFQKNNLLVRVGKYSLQNLPTLRQVLAVLKIRGVNAKFIFSSTGKKLRIMEQIERYGHQIIFEGSRPEWAEKDSLLFSPHSCKPALSKNYCIDFDRRADAPGQTISQLVDFIRKTKPEEKLLVDPYQNSNVPWALLIALKKPTQHDGQEYLQNHSYTRRQARRI